VTVAVIGRIGVAIVRPRGKRLALEKRMTAGFVEVIALLLTAAQLIVASSELVVGFQFVRVLGIPAHVVVAVQRCSHGGRDGEEGECNMSEHCCG